MMKNKNVAPLKIALQKGVEKDTCHYYVVQSDGTTGKEWIKFFAEEGIFVERSAKSVLNSLEFIPTSRKKSIIAIYDSSCMQKVFNEPRLEDPVVPTAEIACLLFKKLKGHGLKALRVEKLAVLHKPITGQGNLQRILVICCNGRGVQRLSSSCVNKRRGRFHGVDGIALAVIKKR